MSFQSSDTACSIFSYNSFKKLWLATGLLLTFLAQSVASANTCDPNTVLAHQFDNPQWNLIVAKRQQAVVALMEADNFVCSGTLIASNLVITNRHCSDDINKVRFNYRFDPDSQQFVYDAEYSVSQYVETAGIQGLDYQLIQLQGNPASEFGIEPTPISAYLPAVGDQVMLIGHPEIRPTGGEVPDHNPRPQAIAVGDVLTIEPYTQRQNGLFAYRYNIRAYIGSSGSGILDRYGNLVGVHAHFAPPNDCAAGAGAEAITSIAKVSPVVRNLAPSVALRVTGNTTLPSSITASCGKAPYQQCSVSINKSADFYQAEGYACDMACPYNAYTRVTCSVGAAARHKRELESIKLETYQPTARPRGRAYHLQHLQTRRCSGSNCSLGFRTTKPQQVTCTFTD